MESITLQSLGGAETVTGSKHLLKTPELTLLIDCGLFQGVKYLREQNWKSLNTDISEIDALILTHAHLDHCGYIPLLVKNGFKGKIYMTSPTKELTKLILLDSAKLQEEDAEKANRHHYTKHHPAKPLYTVNDTEKAFNQFVIVNENEEIKLSNHVHFRFKPCGHIIGACSVEVVCFEKTIIFSGDIGRNHSAILPAPDFFTHADFLVMESTYGDRLHDNTDLYDELEHWINITVKNHGNIIIPSFAVGRAQEIIYILHQLKKQNRIPFNIPIVLDSPMAASATDIMLHYANYTTIDQQEWLEIIQHITINREYEKTRKIIQDKKSKIIIAGSGMVTGGRVLEYLKHDIGNSRNTVLIVGFQAEGTRGRALLNRTHELKMHGKFYPVKANIVEITGLSAHADQSELMEWIKKYENPPKQIMLVHGEFSALEALRVKIQTELQIPVTIMMKDQEVVLSEVNVVSSSQLLF
ncbi:MBL fold metallo-hydrolase RNA specificity domain-containing protein [Chryseobacterium daecheongense]|uniref:MBL fold metallo-hydrolase n=1 Tax=Chryseobacterium daecheongense TaxID=192389 RepID=A0A3N0W413_9FLAO|nr:MBL fold metallo-hydrolase [Chryseobacterium daecheongense]ROH99806.1 MBL fold metallo-hydrolase [Chryseobacterium daecheongense]TDX95264.1 metallo-beta-lactamase family protein [Chryseobacterium daecheongense]